MYLSIRLFLFAGLLALAAPLVRGGEASADWQRVLDLDAGPKAQPRTDDEAWKVAMEHIDLQERAVRQYLAQHPGDEHSFEARLRLARLLRRRGDLQSSQKAIAESQQIMDQLEKTATPEQRAEIEFTRIAGMMRSYHKNNVAQRDDLLNATRRFQFDHPADRRLASLLTEIATLFDSDPKTKDALLSDALRLATDEELKARISDDLKRVELLGKELPLHFTALDGKEVDLANLHGKVVLVLFFATWSPPSMEALASVQKAVAHFPKDGPVAALGINLDEKREPVVEALAKEHVTWPVAYDGKSWAGPVVRSLGINTLPTLWLIDAQGRLRSINVVDDPLGALRQLVERR